MAYPDRNNPFYTEKDDDFGFGGKHSNTSRGGGSGGGYHSKKDPFDDLDGDPTYEQYESEYDRVQKQMQASRNRQLDSTNRALASIYDSERTGVATAEELIHQGEQLDNIERKTGHINQDLKVSQKHINGIKSVFGGIKNWWTGKKEEPKSSPTAEPLDKPRSKLQDEVDRPPGSVGVHPGMRIRDHGYDDDPGVSWGEDIAPAKTRTQESNPTSQSAAYEQKLDQNLDMMSDGMTKLRGLAMGLGDEIGRQNEQIDRIDTQVDRADTTVRRQNREMKHILRK